MIKVYLYIAVFSIVFPLVIEAQVNSDRFYNIPQEKQRPGYQSAGNYYFLGYRVHGNGSLRTTIFNHGVLGNVYDVAEENNQHSKAPDYYFPRNGRFRHGFYTALWVGGIYNRDTLVSTAIDCDYDVYNQIYRFEFLPYPYPWGDFIDLSPRLYSLYTDDFSKSQNTYQGIFYDTTIVDYYQPFHPYDARRHKPLGIQVTQTSYSWSYRYAEDFLIVDYRVENLNKNKIDDVYIGLYHKGAIHHIAEVPSPKLDDLEGFLETYPYEFPELGEEEINAAWTCDVNGNPKGIWDPLSTVNCFAIAPLYVPEEATTYNFNWWVNISNQDWGPRKKDNVNASIRTFYGDLGTPHGDKSKYYMMAHPEVDYSGYEAQMNYQDDGWIEPPSMAEYITRGHQVYYLLSWGPFDLESGESKNVTVVYSVGEDFHTNPYAYADIFNPFNPKPFLDQLNFEDLINNIRWAKRVYDNPGVDTNHDGDSGKYIFIVDSISFDSTQVFYEGDGVPDFRGAEPPPAPEIRIKTVEGKVTLRWNGREAENFFDTFSLIRDFEGYRIYISRSPDESEFVLLESFDKENFNRYEWSRYHDRYELKDLPFTVDVLKQLYGADFDPYAYTRVHPFEHDGKYYIFTENDFNASDLSDPEKIHKVYPEAQNDTTDVDEEGRMRYYEYEYTIDNLLPTVPYYVSVTAFDFGYPAKSLDPLESVPSENMRKVFVVDVEDDTDRDNNSLNVYCYPNPYRVDADYAGMGFENRGTNLAVDRARSIYFANLPNKCTISIYSLDGDLIRRLKHDSYSGSGEESIQRWDLITRNTQATTSGLYYWVVESEYGNQIGKIVIIK